MPSYLQPNDPTRVDFKKGQRKLRPLPPPGNDYTGAIHHDVTLHYRAKAQLTTLTLGGSTATDDVTTMTVTPNLTAQGSAWADDLPPLVVSFTTGATETLAAVAAGIDAAVDAAVLVSDLDDLANYARWADFVEVTSDGVDIEILALNPGAKFTVALSSTGSVTSGQVSENDTDTDLIVGTFAVRDGRDLQGVAYGGAPTSSSTPDKIEGIVMDGLGTRPVSSGYPNKSYPPGADARIRAWGDATVYCETPASADDQVYARKTATGTEIAGAASATAVLDTPEVYTLTPTPANNTLYAYEIEILNFFTGAKVAEGIVQFTSDVDATAAEIVTGLNTSLADDNDQLDAYVTGGGTVTQTLTMASPYIAKISPYAPGVLAGYDVPSTPAASDHMLVEGAKFLETTTAAGIQAVDLPHP